MQPRRPGRVEWRINTARDSLPGQRNDLPPGSLPSLFTGPHADENREPPPGAPTMPPWYNQVDNSAEIRRPRSKGSPMSCRKLIGIALWFLGNYLGVYCIAIADNLFLRILGWLWVSSAISFAGVFMMLAWMHKENHHPDGSSFDP